MKGESLRRLDTELYEETNEKDSWGPRFPLADPSISSQVLVSRVIGQVPTAGQKRGSRKLVGLVPGSRHLASNPCVTASAFIAMNPEALPPPHSICFNATSRNESPDPEQPQTGAGLGGPRLRSLDCEHVFDRLLPTVERNINEATVRLAGRRAIIIRWWIEDRDSWNQRPCSKNRLAVPPTEGICTPVTMT